MPNLVDKINALSREGVFEAVRMLGYDTFEIEPDQATEEAAALAPLSTEPYQNIEGNYSAIAVSSLGYDPI